MRDYYSDRRGRDNTRNKSRERSHERKPSDRDDRRRHHHHDRNKGYSRRSRSRSVEKRRDRNRSHERNRRDNDKNRNYSKPKHETHDKEDFRISPMAMDDEGQEDITNTNGQNIHGGEPEEFAEDYQNNHYHSHSSQRGVPEKNDFNKRVEEPVLSGGVTEIKNMYRETSQPQFNKSMEDSTSTSKPVATPTNKQEPAQEAMGKISNSNKQSTPTNSKEITVANTCNEEQNGKKKDSHSTQPRQIVKPNEPKQQKIISIESIRSSETRNEASRQHIDELLASIKKQRAGTPRLEKIPKGSQIESIINESGQRVLVKKKPESSKVDLRAKIHVVEDSSKSILDRIKKSF